MIPEYISNEAAHLINLMCSKNPEERLEILDCLNHPWFKGGELSHEEMKRIRNKEKFNYNGNNEGSKFVAKKPQKFKFNKEYAYNYNKTVSNNNRKNSNNNESVGNNSNNNFNSQRSISHNRYMESRRNNNNNIGSLKVQGTSHNYNSVNRGN